MNNKSITSEYDLAGRLIKTTDKAGVSTTYTYDAVGNMLSATRDGNVIRQYTNTPLMHLTDLV